MKKLVFIPVCAAAMMMAVSCATSRKATVADLSGEWNVVQINGQSVKASEGQDQPYLGFDTSNGRIFGNAGCNSVMGSFNTKAADGAIDLSGLASTRMMCPDMTVEDNLFGALRDVTAYKLTSAGDIELCNASGDAKVTLQKRQPSVSVSDLDGAWTITDINGQPVTVDDGEVCEITFDLKDNTFSCTTPCNSIMGTFSSEFMDFSFDPTGATRMMCPDMSVEESLMKVLPTVTSFGKLADGSIGFYDADNDIMMIISRK